MPLKKGTSDEVFSQNVAELVHKYKKTGKIGKSRPKGADKARKQALAIAFSMKDKS